jgi:hypothetical protein
MDIEKAGEKIDEIEVEISYKIIELFSAGLYSSPNKAFEELVSNSYDALATKVCVFIPTDINASNALIWVCDNGIGMDRAGLKDLWKIGWSNKREGDKDKDRLQIGKFGIGKLSTYVLARKLSHLCKNGDEYLSVTMDYSTINKMATHTERIKLDERKLKLQEVQQFLNPLIYSYGRKLLNFDLWGDNAENNWTMAIMTDLKPKATEIQDGRLKWVLRTALPLNPNFQLYYNGVVLDPSKKENQPIKYWIIGKDDDTAKKYYETGENKGTPVVNFPHLKNVAGKFELYEESLVTGKSEKLGRSHGIFLMVRNRLVNVDDPLLGMDAFTHGAFNRTRITCNADGLDEYLTSTREAIAESIALSELKEYISRKFNNEVREFWNTRTYEEEKRNRVSYRVFASPASLSRRPLLVLARKFFNKEISNLVLTEIPRDLTANQQQEFIKKLEEDLTSEKGIIENITWEILESESPIARFDLGSRTAKVNLMHPFFANYSEDIKSPVPFQLIAVTEILTEAYLVELGVEEEIIRNIMWRRDQILRDLTLNDKPNSPLVAQLIKDSLANPTGLEDAIFKGFNSLGFDTTKLGGNGKPDGLATAFLGYGSNQQQKNYSLVYDAKSTEKEKIKAATAKISASVRHREIYKAKYSVVIAIDFDGANDPESAISLEAKSNKVNCIRARDFMRLILLSAPKQIGLPELEDLLTNNHTIIETSNWIKNIESKEIIKGPIKELCETIYELQKTDTEPPEIAALRQANKTLLKCTKEEIKTLIQSLVRLVPGFISMEGDIVSLQVPPEKIQEAINSVLNTNIPLEFRDLYFKAFDLK